MGANRRAYEQGGSPDNDVIGIPDKVHAFPADRNDERDGSVWMRCYAEPTWEPLEEFRDTEALENFEGLYGDVLEHDGDQAYFGRRARRAAGEAPQ